MENKNKSGSKTFRLIIFIESPENNTLNGIKKKAKEFAVFQKEMSEFRINGKNTVPVLCIDYLKRHRGSAVNGVLGFTGRTETAVTPEWNEFESTTFRTTIHCTTKRRITAINHAVNIFDDRFAWM